MEQLESHNKQLLDAHNTLVKRIYVLCNAIDEQNKLIMDQNNKIIPQNKTIIYGAIIGILFGGMVSFLIFLLLYQKGIIQGWLF